MIDYNVPSPKFIICQRSVPISIGRYSNAQARPRPERSFFAPVARPGNTLIHRSMVHQPIVQEPMAHQPCQALEPSQGFIQRFGTISVFYSTTRWIQHPGWTPSHRLHLVIFISGSASHRLYLRSSIKQAPSQGLHSLNSSRHRSILSLVFVMDFRYIHAGVWKGAGAV